MTIMGNKTAILFRTAAAAALLLAGCSDPKAANKANFAKAIEPLLANLPCRRIEAGEDKPGESAYPWHYPVIMRAETGGLYPVKRDTFLLDQFVAAGLMTVSRTSHQGQGLSGPHATITLASYAPVAGERDIRLIDQNVHGAGVQKLPAFCIGEGKLDSIESWTEPADMLGSRVTVVTYRWKADGMSPKTAAMIKKSGAAAVPPVNTARVRLTLTSEGWRPIQAN